MVFGFRIFECRICSEFLSTNVVSNRYKLVFFLFKVNISVFSFNLKYNFLEKKNFIDLHRRE